MSRSINIRIIFCAICLFVITNIFAQNQKVLGEYLIQRLGLNDYAFYIHSNDSNEVKRVPFASYKYNSMYSMSTVLSHSDSVIFIKYFHTTGSLIRTIRTDLVMMDFTGNEIRTIITSNPRCFIYNASISHNDSLLLYTKEFNVRSIEGQEICTEPAYNKLVLYDLNRNLELAVIDNSTITNLFELNKKAFSSIENKFVYTKRKEGVYVFDINSHLSKKISPNGFCATWNPKRDVIAYIADKNIYLYDCLLDKTECIYTAKENQEIFDICWTSDGTSVFFRSPTHRKYTGNLTYGEFLLNIDSRSITPLAPFLFEHVLIIR